MEKSTPVATSKLRWYLLLVIVIMLLTLSALHFLRKAKQQDIHGNEEDHTIHQSVVHNTNGSIVVQIHGYEHNVTNVTQESIVHINDPEQENTTWRCVNPDYIGDNARTSVALLKVHKAGSTTIASILYRFGIRRRLSFIMQKDNTHQFWPKTIDKAYKGFYPACRDDKYDILNIHSRYNGRDILTNYMREDTYVIAPLRHPMDQMMSGLYYYGYINKLKKMGKTIEEFLDNPNILTNDPLAMRLMWNSMSSVIGLDDFDIPKGSKKSYLISKPKYIKEIDRFLNWTEENIDFFLIREKFDESLILLKDRLGWRIEDLVYFSLNAAAEPPKRNRRDTNRLRIKTEEFSYIDYLLYERMKLKLDRMIEEKGAELEVEVSKLRSLNKEFSEYCLEKVEVDPTLYGAVKILGNKVKNEHKDNKCCHQTALNELQYVGEIKKYMANSCGLD
ncbi:Galactosylceramide sulfotransferase-like [Oopsacas minuta]|uniref:Galactosylceramide sulfotransferase-like n=1 Tax=Oopsacas minuta TaxID=111878 RepID=A0AAV7JEU2_9METZ|nr:Galactosylceramide sulfotransferase-like [Oopsacas minuta]